EARTRSVQTSGTAQRDRRVCRAPGDRRPQQRERRAARGARPDQALVRSDREKLIQILINLLSNAIKFTDAGGRITVDTSTRPEASNGFVFVRVTDTGIGIARDKQDSIFDPFVQVHRKLSSASEG